MLICVCSACFALFTFTFCRFPPLPLPADPMSSASLLLAPMHFVSTTNRRDLWACALRLGSVIKTLQGRGPATIRNSIVILRKPAHCEGVFQIVEYANVLNVYTAGLVSNWHITTISASSTNCSLRGTLNETNNKMAVKFIEH